MTGPAPRSLSAAIAAMGGTLLAGQADGVFYRGGATDNRAVKEGRLFFALKGERVDGFDFCAAAVMAGAAAVVVAGGRGLPPGCAGVPVIAVTDPRVALGDLARTLRAAFKGRVVGITGSNGKTTTKELCAAALDLRDTGPGGDVLRTAGNFNTEIGLPLTILESHGQEEAWVLEMAMRGRGEIALLADIARPHVGLVTNVAAAHLGRLGSLQEVARAKGEIYGGLAPEGIGVLPVDEPLLETEAAVLPEPRKRRFGGPGRKPTGARADGGDVRVLDFAPAGARGAVLRLAVGGEPAVVHLPLAGEHNARNAAAALAVVLALGRAAQPAATAMERVELPAHRSRLLPVAGRMILDDCYNANPASMAAALRTAAGSVAGAGRPFAVLGDMLELGDDAEALHRETGALVGKLGFAGLVAVGPTAERYAEGARGAGIDPARVAVTEDPKEAAAVVADWTRAEDWILVKASRGLRLERVIEALLERLGGRA